MSKPNIVYIIADQHRWDFMGYETNGVTHTPNLDRIATECKPVTPEATA